MACLIHIVYYKRASWSYVLSFSICNTINCQIKGEVHFMANFFDFSFCCYCLHWPCGEAVDAFRIWMHKYTYTYHHFPHCHRHHRNHRDLDHLHLLKLSIKTNKQTNLIGLKSIWSIFRKQNSSVSMEICIVKMHHSFSLSHTRIHSFYFLRFMTRASLCFILMKLLFD